MPMAEAVSSFIFGNGQTTPLSQVLEPEASRIRRDYLLSKVLKTIGLRPLKAAKEEEEEATSNKVADELSFDKSRPAALLEQIEVKEPLQEQKTLVQNKSLDSIDAEKT